LKRFKVYLPAKQVAIIIAIDFGEAIWAAIETYGKKFISIEEVHDE